MKILSISQYVYIPKYKQTHRLNTGYGHATWDISENIAINGDESYVFTYQPKKAIESDGVKINSLTTGNLIKNLKLNNILFYFKTAMKQNKIKWALREFLHHLCEGSLMAFIKKVKPDGIIIHGVGLDLISSLVAVIHSKTPFIVVLHGLNACNDSAGLTLFQKNYEKNLVKWLNNYGVKFAVVSSGTRRDLVNIYGIKNKENIRVIFNGIQVEDTIDIVQRDKIRKQIFGDNSDKKIILSVSSLSDRKNQISLVKAFGCLNENERDEYILVIIGDGIEKENIEDCINKMKLKDQVIMTGCLDREEVYKYYQAADLTAIISLSEGFGLPIIESYSKGTPVLIFDDLDAVEDLYDVAAMYKCKRGSEQQLINDIKVATSIEWNHYKIIDISRKYDIRQTGREYNQYLKESIKSFIPIKEESILIFLEQLRRYSEE